MPQSARILASALRDPLATVLDLGGEPEALCRAAGVDPAEAEAPGPATLPLRAYVAFSQQAAERLRAPHFGRLAGRRFDIANIGGVGAAAPRAPTLGAALRLFEAAFASVQGDSEVRLEMAGDAATLSYRILDPEIWPRDQDAELTLGVFAALIGGAAGPGWRPLRLEFEHPDRGADHAAGAEARCAVVYGAPLNALTFPARLLDLAMPAAEPEGFRAAAAALAREARRRDREAGTAARVRRAVLRDLGRGPVDQTAVARSLGLSRRSLRRRLEVEGTHFADILAACRDALARRLLAETDAPAAEIAERLGYSEATAFERAFRRRTGLTPAAWRRARREP